MNYERNSTFANAGYHDGVRLQNSQKRMAQINVKERTGLRSFNFGWIKLTDHFISTVGPSAGLGTPLGSLLVLADAEIAPRSSFPLHSHSNMEILTWVIKGRLHHKDNQGGDQFVDARGLQLMSARDGISHAEGNSDDSPLRLLQIWIQPSKRMIGKAIVKSINVMGKGFQLLAGPDGAPLFIEQNASLWASLIDDETQVFEIEKNCQAYAVSIGNLNWNGTDIADGDGILLSDGSLEVKGSGQAIILIQKNEVN